MRSKKKNEKKDVSQKNQLKNRSSSDFSTSSDEWDEQQHVNSVTANIWRTYGESMQMSIKDGYKSNQYTEEKKHIGPYNSSKRSRELNPCWKDGGSGVPQTSENLRKSGTFIEPSNDDTSYSTTMSTVKNKNEQQNKHKSDYDRKSFNCRLDTTEKSKEIKDERLHDDAAPQVESKQPNPPSEIKEKCDLYLSDQQMNKLAAKIVKTEKFVKKLKSKLNAAKEYRKNNPNIGKIEDEGIVLMSTSSTGNSRLLTNNFGDPRNKGNKRKAQTHAAEGRLKYSGDDNKYNLAQMSSDFSTSSDEWDEQQHVNSVTANIWRTYGESMQMSIKDGYKSNQDTEEKKHIGPYNSSKRSRELNPCWKDGGSGVQQTSENLRKSGTFIEPSNDDTSYSTTISTVKHKNEQQNKHNSDYDRKSFNSRLDTTEKSKEIKDERLHDDAASQVESKQPDPPSEIKEKCDLYLSDQQMNKLAAKIVKTEEFVKKLKSKLNAAKEYRKNNPNIGKIEDDGIVLMSTSSTGNRRLKK